MSIGFGIFLIVVGAIVRYAINFDIAGVEEGTVGLILIVAGVVIALLGLIAAPFRLWAERRRGYDASERDTRYRY